MKMHNHKWTKSNSLVPLQMALAVLSYYGNPIDIGNIAGLSFKPHREYDVGSGLVHIKGFKQRLRLYEPTKVRRVDLQLSVYSEDPIDISHVKTLVLWDHDSQKWIPALLEFGNSAFSFRRDFTPLAWKRGRSFVQPLSLDPMSLWEEN